VSPQCVEVGDARRDDSSGADVADSDGGLVDEPDTGGGCHGDATVDRRQGPQLGRDRHLAIEAGGGFVVGQGDEPLGAWEIRRHRDTSHRCCNVVAGFDGQKHAAARLGGSLELGGAVGVDSSRDEQGVVPAVYGHSGDPSQAPGSTPRGARKAWSA
jgi:hypothetical protein